MGGAAEGGKIQPHALGKNAPQPVKRQTAGPRDLDPAACVVLHRQPFTERETGLEPATSSLEG